MIETLIKRKVTTTMIFLGICLMGFISLDKLPVQLLPNIEFPKLTIITPYENAAPGEVEKLVTKYIEESVGSVNGVLSIYSESLEGLSLVTARFNWGLNMDMALVETKEKADMIKPQLPEDTGKSIVVKYDPKAAPIMIYSIKNKKGDFKRTRKRVEKEILPYLERLEGVALVDVIGGYKRQINVDIDSAKIYSHNLSLSEVMQNVNMANYNFPAGSLEKGNKEYLVRTIGEFKSIDEINSVVVGRGEQGAPIYLERIASITDSYKDRKCIIRLDGKESIALLVRKEPGKNTVEVCKRIINEITKLNKKYKEEFSISGIYNQSEFIQNSVNNVFTSAIIGGIIAIFILWFFLKEVRSPLVIATSIPVSIIGTFALMYFRDISINTMSLGGLALGVGMMVDSGIVVLESISKTKTETGGFKNVDAVIKGAKAVTAPVISSILTSIVVFLPIVFLSGLSGAVFGELALTISFALFFSLLSSVTLVPMLSTLSSGDNGKFSGIVKFFGYLQKPAFILSDKIMNYLTYQYYRMINFSLKHKFTVLQIGIIILLAGAFAFKFIDFEIMPKVDPGEFSIDIEAPSGTTLEESSNLAKRIEELILKKEYVKNVFAKIGSDPEENIAEKTSGRRSNNILLQVFLKKERKSHITGIVDALKKEIQFGENIKADFLVKENVIEAIFSRRTKPVHIEIYGKEVDDLKAAGVEIKEKLKPVKGIRNISTLFEKLDPELKVDIDRNKIAALGISIADVASTVKAAIHGEVVTKFREKDDEIDIRVRLRKTDRTEKDAIYRILVKTQDGASVPILKFADIKEGVGASKIIRNEQSRINIITADISGSSNVLKRIEKIVDSVELKEGYDTKLVGDKDEIKKAFKEMRFALILAVILIYMLLASQFQSFKNPIIIMLSIPVASIGISGALLLTGKTLNINSGIGIIMLTGIVVNNAIVLFDYIEKEKAAGSGMADSIVEAGIRRLKPILMTTLTTIFALLPIALGIGQGSELQQPMAIAVIGGLLVSTFLTLIFIPTVYAIMNKK